MFILCFKIMFLFSLHLFSSCSHGVHISANSIFFFFSSKNIPYCQENDYASATFYFTISGDKYVHCRWVLFLSTSVPQGNIQFARTYTSHLRETFLLL